MKLLNDLQSAGLLVADKRVTGSSKRLTVRVSQVSFQRLRWLLVTTGAVFLLCACDGVGDSVSGQSENTVSNPTQPETNLTFTPEAPSSSSSVPRSDLTQLESSDEAPTLVTLQQQIFTPHCSHCHVGGGEDLPESLNLTNAADTYASVIGSVSTEYPQLELVAPGESTNSYLVRKLEGTQQVGQQMPLSGGPLPIELISDVKVWIDSGAIY